MTFPRVARTRTARQALILTEVRKPSPEILRAGYDPDEYRAERDQHAEAIRHVMQSGKVFNPLATRHLTAEQGPC